MTFVNIFNDFYSDPDAMLENHYDHDRDYTNTLIEQSDKCDPLNTSRLKKTVYCDWNEAVCSWKETAPFPRYVSTANAASVMKRRILKNDVRSEENPWHPESKTSVKCVGEDFESFPVPDWKANVEQGTFRYVSNNGYYRTVKFVGFNDKRDWYTVHKKHPELVSMSWQNKRFHKELKRSLRRDLEVKFHYHHRQQQSLAEHKNEIKENTTPEPKVQNPIESPYKTTETRVDVRSVQSDVPRSTSSPVKDNGGSLKNKNSPMFKSTSDLYIEKFSSRIIALEEELLRDSRIRKSQENAEISSKPPVYPTKLKDKETTPRNSHLSKKKEKEKEPASDLMTVKSIVQKPELRPVEKLTPTQRGVGAPERDTKKVKSNQLRYTNIAGSDSSAPSIPTYLHVNSPDLEKALNSYKMAIETTKQSLFNTLTSTKVQRRHTVNSNKASFSAPASVTLSDTLSNESRSEHLSPECVQTVSNKERMREKNPFAGRLLPEISGKRLEVATTFNRWL